MKKAEGGAEARQLPMQFENSMLLPVVKKDVKKVVYMSKRGENIHKRKDGRWEARILYKDSAGKQKYHSLYGKSYREVKEKKEQYVKSSREERPRAKPTQFSAILNMWLGSRFFHQKESTKLKYRNIIDRHIIPQLGGADIAELDDVRINEFLADKRENGRLDGSGGLSNSYIKTMAIIISSAMNYAAEKGLRSQLSVKIQKPVTIRREISVLSEEAQKKFENRLKHSDSLSALGILIALNTGLRIGEICALKWEDIDVEAGVIHVRHSIVRISSQDSASDCKTSLIVADPKTKTSRRDIPINTKLSDIISLAAPLSESDFVVSDSAGFVSPRTFEYRFHRILKQYGLQDVNFHALRHTFATRCVEKNVDIKTLSEVLGHSNVSITLNTYVHPSFESKRKQMEKLCDI